MKTLLIVALSFALSSCAPPQYVRSNVPQTQFDRDKQECIYEGQLHSQDNPLNMLVVVPQCMRARGYQRTR